MKTIKVEIEKRLPSEANFWQVFASVGFWNENGQKAYDDNRAGKMGSKFTQDAARSRPIEEWVLNSLYHDIETLSSNGVPPYWEPGWKFGRGGNHIWIANQKNERVVFIHF